MFDEESEGVSILDNVLRRVRVLEQGLDELQQEHRALRASGFREMVSVLDSRVCFLQEQLQRVVDAQKMRSDTDVISFSVDVPVISLKQSDEVVTSPDAQECEEDAEEMEDFDEVVNDKPTEL